MISVYSLCILSGEKLDQKQCECIEEVFRRVQFKLLDLEASHLDDECATALFDMIEYYETACQLNISFNKNIQARGWQACSRLVRRTPNLTYLDIRSCDLNERFMPIFGRALKLGCHLTILHMEGLVLSGRPLVILVAALKMNETLQELFLADNKLMPTDGVQLGNLLRYNHKLSLLDLRNNHLQDVGTSHLCDGLLEQNLGRGLHTLVLWNNQINYQAMSALGRALASSECLETLNIGHNAITNEGVHLLKDGLLKTNSLLRLGLQGTKISDEGAVALAEYIADSNILLRIDLRENEIKTGGLMALSHAMRVNTSVTRIDLDKEPKKESGIKDYADQQSRLLRDIVTFQQRNIQVTIEKEEQERKKLEEKAEAAEAARKLALLENAQEIVDNIINESFTLIEEEEAETVDKDACQEKYKKNIENLKLKDEVSHSEPSVEKTENESLAEVSVVEKHHHRPSQLFPYKHMHPQETLDSPIPTTNENPLIAVMTTTPIGPPSSPQLYRAEKNLLSSLVTASPPEMILSPQYFPKQIARKIFSVSRVDEDPSWSKLSTSPTPSSMAGFDPLNISPVPLVSISYTQSSHMATSSSPMIIPQISQLSTNVGQQQPSSPCSSLLQSLSEQSEQLMAVASNLHSSGSDSLGFLPCDTSVTADKSSHIKKSNCDNHEVSSAAVSSGLLSSIRIEKELKRGKVVTGNLSQEDGRNSVNLIVDSVQDANDYPAILMVSDQGQEDLLSSDPQDDNVFEEVEGEDITNETISAAVCTRDNNTVCSSILLSETIFSDDTDIFTPSANQQAANIQIGAGDVIQFKESQECTSPQTILSCAGSVLQSNHQASASDDGDLNCSNSIKPLQVSDPVLRSSAIEDVEPTLANKLGSVTLTGININTHNEVLIVGKYPSQPVLSNSDIDVVGHKVCDSLDADIETVELSGIDEEPWLAVGVDNEVDLEKSDHSAKQPDFFTTLSSNGFTQELASALTSLDGSNGYFEEDNNFELQSPDEFEKELDSMLSLVHGDLPWLLKDS
ncbi:hypothetical protein Btru_046769 [Bulinus truncatus]|nr:hypothetical protein Btru_046769 [Bulinus truncatus]